MIVSNILIIKHNICDVIIDDGSSFLLKQHLLCIHVTYCLRFSRFLLKINGLINFFVSLIYKDIWQTLFVKLIIVISLTYDRNQDFFNQTLVYFCFKIGIIFSENLDA